MAKTKDMVIKITPDQVLYTNISKSKDGYNSARVVAKVSEKEYMSVSYEWEGEGIPDFAMSLMSFMQANEIEVGVNEECATEYEEMVAAKKKGKNPFVKKDDDMEDEDPKDKKNKKKDKKTGKKKESCSDDDATEEE